MDARPTSAGQQSHTDRKGIFVRRIEQAATTASLTPLEDMTAMHPITCAAGEAVVATTAFARFVRVLTKQAAVEGHGFHTERYLSSADAAEVRLGPSVHRLITLRTTHQ